MKWDRSENADTEHCEPARGSCPLLRVGDHNSMHAMATGSVGPVAISLLGSPTDFSLAFVAREEWNETTSRQAWREFVGKPESRWSLR